MQIVIDICKDTYDKIMNGKYVTNPELGMAIRNGTPLPEHHGSLIDAGAFQKYCFDKNFDKRLSEGGLATINMFLELQPTIIEGSKDK